MAGTKSTGKAGLGARLQLGDGASPEVFATVGNVVSLEAAGATINMIDATHLNSADFYGETLPGLKTSQPWTGTIQFDESDVTQSETTGLRKRFEDRTKVTLRINLFQLGLTKGFEADGYVTELGNVSFGAESIMTQSFTFSPTGKVRIVPLTA